jgi:hypothetical protein
MLREFIPSEEEYDGLFDRFEYLFAMVFANRCPDIANFPWVPLGRFMLKYSPISSGEQIGSIITSEIEKEGENWAPLQAGLFDGSLEKCLGAKQSVDTFIGKSRTWF